MRVNFVKNGDPDCAAALQAATLLAGWKASRAKYNG